uniref:Uncharacterized protein n=1 Tax=Trichuris muris TaxID=70415 RepID=A0A5S6QI28_TRIMR
MCLNKPLGRVTKEEREIVLAAIREISEEDKLMKRKEKEEKRKMDSKRDKDEQLRNRGKKKEAPSPSSEKPTFSKNAIKEVDIKKTYCRNSKVAVMEDKSSKPKSTLFLTLQRRPIV